MNPMIEKKLAGVLGTVTGKLTDNLDFFKEMTVEYKNGNKVQKGRLILNDLNQLVWEEKKNRESVDISDLADLIIKKGKEYEDCSIKYFERGSIMTIWTDKGGVRIKSESASQGIAAAHDDVTARSHRDYLVKVGEANDVLREIGILTAEGKVRNDMIRKYNQIDHFVELIQNVLKELQEKDSITILDCACGKSYLSFVLNYYIKEKLKKNCYFIGLDISEQVILSSRKMAANLGYKNMEFLHMDIQNYLPNRDIDLVISLHGCDIATDMAIAAGIRYKAGAIVVIPCCHKEILSQYEYEPFKEITKYGVLKARLADTLTDGIRGLLMETMGYEVSIVEYISPLDTPKNIMIRGIKKSGRNKKAYETYLEIKEALGIRPTLGRLINM